MTIGTAPAGGSPSDAGASTPTSRPVFWKELYWFALICLGAWIVAVAILSPRFARNRKAYETEDELRRVCDELARKEGEFQAAIEAMENDPYYRDGIYRWVLKVKKSDEIPLKSGPEVSDNVKGTEGSSSPTPR